MAAVVGFSEHSVLRGRWNGRRRLCRRLVHPAIV